MDPLEFDLPTLVSLGADGVAGRVLECIERDGYHGVKPSHGYVIQRLVDDEPTITALAASLGMTQQGASKQVSDLESLGYVERVAVPGDQRARRVRLTRAGRGVLASGRRARAVIEAEIVDRVGPDAAASARLALAALLDVTGLTDRARSRSVPPPPE